MAEILPPIADEDTEGIFWRIAANEQRLDNAASSPLAYRAARLALSTYTQKPKVAAIYESLIYTLIDQFELAPHEIIHVLNRSENNLSAVNQDML
jgi:hypothetical protein